MTMFRVKHLIIENTPSTHKNLSISFTPPSSQVKTVMRNYMRYMFDEAAMLLPTVL